MFCTKQAELRGGRPVPNKITKQQIIAWLSALIEQGESPNGVMEAMAVLELFITWWQTTHDRAWDPCLWTRQDEEAYRPTIPAEQRKNSFTWLHRFRRWLVDQGALPN